MNVLIGLDQWANTVLGGSPDETISSRAGRANQVGKRWARSLCWALDKLDPGHCGKSVQSERDRSHFPPELR